jgi:hypothetical protein
MEQIGPVEAEATHMLRDPRQVNPLNPRRVTRQDSLEAVITMLAREVDRLRAEIEKG